MTLSSSAHPLDDPRCQGRRDDADQADAADHQQHGDDPAGVGHRIHIAVADGGDRRDRPPQRLAEGVDGRASAGIALCRRRPARRCRSTARHPTRCRRRSGPGMRLRSPSAAPRSEQAGATSEVAAAVAASRSEVEQVAQKPVPPATDDKAKSDNIIHHETPPDGPVAARTMCAFTPLRLDSTCLENKTRSGQRPRPATIRHAAPTAAAWFRCPCREVSPLR